MHKRTQIRNAIVNILDGSTSVGAKVFLNRPHPYNETDLPAIFIYTSEESAIDANLSQKTYKRTLNLAIEARVSSSTSVDESLDDIAEEIENLIKADLTINGLCTNISMTGTEFDQTAEGRKVIGALRLNFEIKYIY